MTIKTFAALEYMTAPNYNTYCQNNGLKWLDTQTTTTATFLRSDVFTSEHFNYRIVISNWKPSVTENLNLRLRTSSGTYSGSVYSWNYLGILWASGAQTTGFATGASFVQICSGVATRNHAATIELQCKPGASEKVTMQTQTVDSLNSCNRNGGGLLNNAADYTGIEIFTNGTTAMNCTMTVYGYRKQ
jgi:hypothetical protein